MECGGGLAAFCRNGVRVGMVSLDSPFVILRGPTKDPRRPGYPLAGAMTRKG